jgi:hypothetical protein
VDFGKCTQTIQSAGGFVSPAESRDMFKKINQESYAMIIKGLLTKPMTIDMMQELTGLHRNTLYELTRCFRKHKIIYISDWEQDRLGRDCFAVFSIGNKKDQPRYKMTAAERTRRYRERKKILMIPTSIKQMASIQPCQ